MPEVTYFDAAADKLRSEIQAKAHELAAYCGQQVGQARSAELLAKRRADEMSQLLDPAAKYLEALLEHADDEDAIAVVSLIARINALGGEVRHG